MVLLSSGFYKDLTRFKFACAVRFRAFQIRDPFFSHRIAPRIFCAVQPAILAARDGVVLHARTAAEASSVAFAVEYDVSGVADDTILSSLKADWHHLTSTLGILQSPSYQHHRGICVALLPALPIGMYGSVRQTGMQMLAGFSGCGAHQGCLLLSYGGSDSTTTVTQQRLPLPLLFRCDLSPPPFTTATSVLVSVDLRVVALLCRRISWVLV